MTHSIHCAADFEQDPYTLCAFDDSDVDYYEALQEVAQEEDDED